MPKPKAPMKSVEREQAPEPTQSPTLDFSRFEILTFDCYGTLIDWEAGILSALRPILLAHKKQIDDAAILKLYGDFEQRSEQGPFRSYREVLESVVSQFGAELWLHSPLSEEVRSSPASRFTLLHLEALA